MDADNRQEHPLSKHVDERELGPRLCRLCVCLFLLCAKGCELHSPPPAAQKAARAARLLHLNCPLLPQSKPAALFGGPTVVLNGRRYASASPLQFCLFPYPFASSPTAPEDTNVLLLRRIFSDPPATLGPIFWASSKVPAGFEAASETAGVLSSSAMDALTQADLQTLAIISRPPCASAAGGSTKCEACANGCGNTTRCERTHYSMPGQSGDMIIQRGDHKQLLYAHRPGKAEAGKVRSNPSFRGITSNPCLPIGLKQPFVVAILRSGGRLATLPSPTSTPT